MVILKKFDCRAIKVLATKTLLCTPIGFHHALRVLLLLYLHLKQTNILEFIYIFIYFKACPAMSPGGLGRKIQLENIQTSVKVNCT